MSFGCDSSRCSEHLHWPVIHPAAVDGIYTILPKNIIATQLSDVGVDRGLWETIVEEFTRRDLSYGADRLAALAGIAARMQRHTGDRYLAGLWRRGLEQQLLWARWHTLNFSNPLGFWNLGRAAECKAQPLRGFPTWSWASCGAAIRFKTRSARRSGIFDFVVQNITMVLGPNRFGSVVSARLDLTCTCTTVAATRMRWTSTGHQESLTFEPEEGIVVTSELLLDGEDPPPRPRNRQASTEPLEVSFVLCCRELTSRPSYIALIVMPTGDSLGTFSRVGMLVCERWPEPAHGV